MAFVLAIFLLSLQCETIHSLKLSIYKEEDSGDDLLARAEQLAKNPDYHAWVDATLTRAGIGTDQKTDWEQAFSKINTGVHPNKCPGFPNKASAEEWARVAEEMKTPIQFHQQCHRAFYGGGIKTWDKHRKNMKFVMGAHMTPDQKFLEVGCGAMNLGQEITKYLNAGNYYGMDADELSLRAAIQYEAPMMNLIEKKPNFIKTEDFNVTRSGVVNRNSIDFIGAFHMMYYETFYDKFCASAAEVLKDDGLVIVKSWIPTPLQVFEDVCAAHGLERVSNAMSKSLERIVNQDGLNFEKEEEGIESETGSSESKVWLFRKAKQ